MRIALVHNPSAGDGDFKADELRRLLEAEGFAVEDYGKDRRAVKRAIDDNPDVIAVAGGDGTVARAAIVSFEKKSPIPLFVLPVGTANNIARSLGLDRPVTALIHALSTAQATRFDIGRARGPGGEAHFVEAAGVGFIGTMLRNPVSRARMIASALRGVLTGTDLDTRRARGVARLIRRQPLRSIAIRADGEELTDDYVAAEAMNISMIGPGLCLAPSADVSDGLLDLVLVRGEDREPLASRVERRATQVDVPAAIIHRVREVEISWEPGFGHVDDGPWPESDAGGMVTIDIAGAVTVLRP